MTRRKSPVAGAIAKRKRPTIPMVARASAPSTVSVTSSPRTWYCGDCCESHIVNKPCPEVLRRGREYFRKTLSR